MNTDCISYICIYEYENINMKNKILYRKSQLFLTNVCAVLVATLAVVSCSMGEDEPSSSALDNPAEMYRCYLSNIRNQDTLSCMALAEQVRQWLVVRDSVFTHLGRDTIGRLHSTLREECDRLHDSIRMEFSHMVLSKPRTYQELLFFKEYLSPYCEDQELHCAIRKIRPFFASLDNQPVYKGGVRQILGSYRTFLAETISNGIHDSGDLKAYIKKEDAIFRAFLSHLHELDDQNLSDIRHDTERCCSQILVAANRKDITYTEAIVCLGMRANRRQIQNMQTCIKNIKDGKVKTSSQARTCVWTLIQPYISLDGFCMTLLSDGERMLLDKMALQTPETFRMLSRIMQAENDRLEELPGMLMDIFIHRL